MYLNYFTFKKEQLICPKCQWSGLGSELSYGDYHESTFIADFLCPKCIEHIGHVQFPLIEEVEEWKKNNPNTDTGWND